VSNMKGLETMPLRFVVVVIVLLIVTSVGFWQINSFMDFNVKKNFKEDIVQMSQNIDFLRNNDHGSVIQTKIGIPNNYNFYFDIDNNKLVGNLSGEIFEVSLEVNLSKARVTNEIISSGKVKFPRGINYISIYYGEIEDTNVKNYTVVII